jgi:endonuclease YncB( thermonuclease family)
MRRLILTLLAIVIPAVLAAAASRAQAQWTAPCIDGEAEPACQFWLGKVAAVHDGDTVEVRITEGPRRLVRVRIVGIQAMEQRVYSSNPRRRRGECHSLEATARLEQLLKASRGVVRLAAQDPASRTGFRWRRSLAVNLNGRWHDVGRILVSEGLALWLPHRLEYGWNVTYSWMAQQAAATGLGLWSTESCGAGPLATLRVKVHANAKGNDSENLNGEWVRIRNEGPTEVSLEDWWIRDSALRRYEFPWWAVVPAGGSIRVRVGDGEPTDRNFYWGLSQPAFENPKPNGHGMGDGAYLFDPQGDLRSWSIYPCYFACGP